MQKLIRELDLVLEGGWRKTRFLSGSFLSHINTSHIRDLLTLVWILVLDGRADLHCAGTQAQQLHC